MDVLGIETSCDETSAAVVRGGRMVLSNVIASQIELHQKTGGVVPEVAAREHVLHILTVIERALHDADCTFDAIDAIAVTQRPGLIASLLVGTSTANTLALLSGKPLIPVNHIEGHIYANWLDRSGPDASLDRGSRRPLNSAKPRGVSPSRSLCSLDIVFPVMVLTVSGGHNELVLMRDHGDFKTIGATRDDAAGEAFDKVARLIGLPYPGGPAISELAAIGDPTRYNLPRAMVKEGYDFSFSGLKSAVARLVHDQGDALNRADLAASFQEAVCDVLSLKLVQAAIEYGVREVHLAGGVSANQHLRAMVESRLRDALPDVPLRFPQKMAYCTDNAAMIAAAGTFQFQKHPEWYLHWKMVEASTRIEFADTMTDEL